MVTYSLDSAPHDAFLCRRACGPSGRVLLAGCPPPYFQVAVVDWRRPQRAAPKHFFALNGSVLMRGVKYQNDGNHADHSTDGVRRSACCHGTRPKAQSQSSASGYRRWWRSPDMGAALI